MVPGSSAQVCDDEELPHEPSVYPCSCIVCTLCSKKFMDALDVLGSASDSDGSGRESEDAEPPPAKPAKSKEIDVETLKHHGYAGGPSVLYVPPPQDEGHQDWAW